MEQTVRVFDPFYEELKSVWDNGGGWGGLYYGIFSEVIRQNGFTKCAEVGIGYGFHAEEILRTTAVEKLYLVDPMQFYPNDGFATDVLKYGGFEQLVRNILVLLGQYSHRYQWFRCPSLSVSNDQIPDGSLDAVFLDADHAYDAVRLDLPFWWKKLRSGGWLLGDDYRSCHPGVTQAVNEFASAQGLPLNFLSKNNATVPDYPIYFFVKP